MSTLKNITRIAYKRDPEKGEKGAILVITSWAAGVRYSSGAAGEKYQHAVFYNGYMYSCAKTHTSVASHTPYNSVNEGDGLWTLESNFEIVATKVIFIGSDGQGWVLDNGVMYHTSGKIQLAADGSIKGANGKMSVDEDGNIQAENLVLMGNCKIYGELVGVSGSFKTLNCVDANGNIVGSLSFSSSGQITISGDLYHQGYNYDESRSHRFYASNIWCRGVFGSSCKTVLLVLGSYAYFYPNGLYDTTNRVYVALTSGKTSAGVTYYTIPTYGTSGKAAGCPVDVVIVKTSATYRFLISMDDGKEITFINSYNTNNNIYIYSNGKEVQVSGGVALHLLDVGAENIYPTQASNVLGSGLMIVGRYDNDWEA